MGFREQIRNGDIFACSGNALYSKVIKAWTGSEITHIGIAVWIQIPGDNEKDRLCILEAHALKGVRLAPLSFVLEEYSKEGGQIYWCPLDDSIDRGKVLAYALKNWTKAYASIYQFVLVASRVFRFFRMTFGGKLDVSEERFHCSELGTRALMAGGYKHNKEPALTTPSDVVNFRCIKDQILISPDKEEG